MGYTGLNFLWNAYATPTKANTFPISDVQNQTLLTLAKHILTFILQVRLVSSLILRLRPPNLPIIFLPHIRPGMLGYNMMPH
jgi:hypothetical protein